MKFQIWTGACALVSMLAGSAAETTAGNAQAQFLTVLVGDFKSNGRQYVDYIRTAASVPPEVTLLAMQVATYTDDSYTTMLTDSNINIGTLEAFATRLPWYSRIRVELASATAAAAGSSSVRATGSSSSSSHSTAGAVQYSPHGAVLGVVALLLL